MMKITKETLKNVGIVLAVALGGGSLAYDATEAPVPKEQITDEQTELIEQGFEAFYTDLVVMDTIIVTLPDGPFAQKTGFFVREDLVKGHLIWKKPSEVVSVPWLNENVKLPAPFEDYEITAFGKLYKK